ncbi:type III-B CRISPR-associated protein Cas10/Cmr2 [Fervidobacterium islandicum]|uniref:type III-B CRISPR-associated protein Cas10/Cmr2 n=1 Tax=Fervidobacterium islandicum TaxID=2423 RepID=UPI003A79631F
MPTTVKWEGKIAALLHDPVFKAFNIQSHEKLARELCEIAGVPYSRGQEDIIGSSLDRVPLPYELYGQQIRVGMEDLNYFIHPISGDKLTFIASELYEKLKGEEQNYIEALKSKVKRLREANKENEKFYHALWWELGYLNEFIGFMPADTRVPNHSIIDHLEITSALQSCKSNGQIDASLLMFAIGPVQEIIAQARKTVDLWAGSYLLSYLAYKAIEKVGVTYGFDTIIYPYLRGNAFVYKTLQNQKVELLTKPVISDKVASIPNVFLAIVPTSQAKDIIQECQDAVKDSWRELAEEVKNKFLNHSSKNIGLFNLEEYKKQIEIFPTINATFLPLPTNVNSFKLLVNSMVKDDEFNKELENFTNFLEFVVANGGYSINTGSFYRYIFKLLTARMNSIKTARYFYPYVSDESIGAQRIPDDFGGGVRACVEIIDLADKSGGTTDYLGTLNTVKRFLRNILKEKGKLEEEIRYESVYDVALRNDANKEIPNTSNEQSDESRVLKNGYIGILIMDGDRMGKLVSGDSAPKIKDILHEKVVEEMQKLNITFEGPMLTPSYQKAVSRTLGMFSSLVRFIVEDKYEGMLVYSGGDDVLAILPADKVLKCANEIRKIYSGVGNIEIKVGEDLYKFSDGIAYKNGIPYTTMMSPSATMSAGISIIHHKTPLRVGIELARKQEHVAKEQIGRNAFSIAIVRRSGQIEEISSKWEVEGMDVIDKTYQIYEKSEHFKLSHRTFYKVFPHELKLMCENEAFSDKVVDFVLKKSEAKDKKSQDFELFSQELKTYVKNILKSTHRLNNPFDLILAVRFTKRGDTRGDGQ